MILANLPSVFQRNSSQQQQNIPLDNVTSVEIDQENPKNFAIMYSNGDGDCINWYEVKTLSKAEEIVNKFKYFLVIS